MPATFGIDGDAGRGKCFDVAQDGARGDLELFGQGIRGQLAALTQQQDQGHQPVSSHDEDVTGIPDTRCRDSASGWSRAAEPRRRPNAGDPDGI